MAWWIYLGKVTTPISGGITATLDERGDKPVIVPRDGKVSTVLVPRLKFEAPMAPVAHLIRLKKVVGLKPHQIPKPPESPKVEEKEPTAAPQAPVVVPKSEEKPKEVPSDGETPVVASDAAEEEPKAPQRNTDEDTGEAKTKVQQEKQKKGGKKGSRRRG